MNRRDFSTVQQLWSGAAAAVLMAGTASAQSAGESVVLEEVVVTAQKRSERLLDVPVPVTAMDSETLVQQNLVSIQDYASRVPGLQTTGNRIYMISLRGVDSFGGNATTAVTVGDIPFVPSAKDAQGIFPDFDPADLARIEVLRGPQGTLYGASAMGGLIKYVPNDPDPNKLSGRLEAGYNHADQGGEGNSLRGSVNVPLWQDKLAMRVSAFRREDPAYLDRIDPLDRRLIKKDANESMTEGGRAAVLFRPVDNLTINASYMKQTLDASGGGAVDLTSGYPPDFKPLSGGYYATTTGEVEVEDEHELTQLRVDWELPFATVTSASGWVKTGGAGDLDVTSSFQFIFEAPFPGFPVVYPDAPSRSQARIINSTQTDKFSQELRIASNGEGRLEWLFGGFYTDEDIDIFQDMKAYAPDRSLIGDVVTFPNHYTLEEKAVFGSITWHFTEQFNVEIGGRYSKNEQTSQVSQRVAPVAVPLFGESSVEPKRRSSEDAVTWLISPQYRINDDLMVYGRAATGYRPGGPNPAYADNPTFDSDQVTNYELGVKGQLFERRLTIDASVFDIEWQDIQLSLVNDLRLDYTANGGKARIRGIEAAAQFIPASGWLISVNATFNDAELRDDFPADPTGGPQVLGFTGDSLPGTAKFSGNIGVEKLWDVFSDYRLTLGANLSHVGDRAIGYRRSDVEVAKQPRFEIPSYEVIDLYARLTNGTWNANFYVRNLGSSHGLISASDGGGQRGLQGNFIAPRIIGLALAWNF